MSSKAGLAAASLSLIMEGEEGESLRLDGNMPFYRI